MVNTSSFHQPEEVDENRPNVSHGARPSLLDSSLALDAAVSFPTPLDQFQMLSEEGLSGEPKDKMGKQETQTLAQYFSPIMPST